MRISGPLLGNKGNLVLGPFFGSFFLFVVFGPFFFPSSMDFLILGFCLCLCWVFVLRGVVDLNQGFLPVFMPI